MILYVNGDSHAAAAEAVNPHAFAEDDPLHFYRGRAPHPDNAAVSWGRCLSKTIKSSLHLDAESASCNDRILRTSRQWLDRHRESLSEVLAIIQWSTWERQEWLIDGVYYQVNGSGIDQVPASHQRAYKEYIANIDWPMSTQSAHEKIWQFHLELENLGVRHIFFNGNNHFGSIATDQRQDWGSAYIGPYDPAQTWESWLKTHGFETVAPKSWHFGADAHAAWARFMLQYIVKNSLI